MEPRARASASERQTRRRPLPDGASAATSPDPDGRHGDRPLHVENAAAGSAPVSPAEDQSGQSEPLTQGSAGVSPARHEGSAGVSPAHHEGSASVSPARHEGSAGVSPAHHEGSAGVSPAHHEGSAGVSPAHHEARGGEEVSTRGGRSWRGRLIAWSLVLAGAVAVGLVARVPRDNSQPPPLEILPVNVVVQPVQAIAELPDTVTLTAVIEPEWVVRVAAEVAGRIESVGAREQDVEFPGRILPPDGHHGTEKQAGRLFHGDRPPRFGNRVQEGEPVEAGQAILQLNQDMPRAQFDRAQAQFEYDQREYRRLLDLYERGATSKTELDNAITRRDVSKAALDEATHQLARTTIVSPRDGILNDLFVEVGEYVGPGDLVAELVGIDRVKVVVQVPERDVRYLRVGQMAEVLVQMPLVSVPSAGTCGHGDVETGGPERNVLTGPITYISALADPGTRTTRLEIAADNRDRLLHSGQIVRARLTRRVLKDAMMIPLEAVIPLEVGYVVYVVDADGTAARRDVELGVIRGRSVQVVRGLTAGDLLIVQGQRYVGPGQPVNIVGRQLGSDSELVGEP